MKEQYKIYNGDNKKILDDLYENKTKIDGVITSPPYNISRICGDMYSVKYNTYQDNISNEEYINWQTDQFNKFDKILITNGCILYNINYGSENTDTIWKLIANIINNTNFTVVDQIIWKKRNAIPNNISKNKLTRIVENIFIFVRKSEVLTFNTNKKVVNKIKKTNQNIYENITNFIEAPNNDRNMYSKTHKATFSSELINKLIKIYFKENSIILDNHMGTGTTGISCIQNNLKFIGIELDEEYFKLSENRLKKEVNNIHTKNKLHTFFN